MRVRVTAVAVSRSGATRVETEGDRGRSIPSQVKRRVALLFATVGLMLFGSVFTATSASAHIKTNGTIRLGCSSYWKQTDLATIFTMQVTCTPTGTIFAWGWKVNNPDWRGVDSKDIGMKWTFSPSGPDGGTHPYNMGSGDQAHGSFRCQTMLPYPCEMP